MQDRDYLLRCLDIAKLGGKYVRPNPHVGAVIVYKDRIIGEGFHKKYGSHHAEVNAINNVSIEDKKHLPQSTIYVSLEPCCHTGNTPPCTDLIIRHKIPKVCIAEVDPSDKVNSKGIQKLRAHGVEVTIIEIASNKLTASFRVNHLQKRPYIQLKFAKSSDNFIGQVDKQIWLSNDTSKIFTHQLRANTDAILIGTNTAITDNPSLTLREYPGDSPQRVVLDRAGKIPLTHHLLSDDFSCIVITENKRSISSSKKQQFILDFSNQEFIPNLLKELYNLNIYHLMIEGGGSVLKSFIKANYWDEAVVINTKKLLKSGIKATNLNGKIRSKYELNDDTIYILDNVEAQI